MNDYARRAVLQRELKMLAARSGGVIDRLRQCSQVRDRLAVERSQHTAADGVVTKVHRVRQNLGEHDNLMAGLLVFIIKSTFFNRKSGFLDRKSEFLDRKSGFFH